MNTARALPILMYHHVSPNPGLVTVSPDNFAAQMAWLAQNGWQGITCEALEQYLQGAPLPAKSVLITFDDGYLDNYVHAHPVLARYGLHAVLFGVTGWFGEGMARPVSGEANVPETPSHKQCHALVDAGKTDAVMLRWSELAIMQTAGTFELHSHTHTHRRWDKQCNTPSEKRTSLAHDLTESQRTLRERLGQCSTHLCWPQGYFDADYLAVAQACGFKHLYTTAPGTVTPHSTATRLPRIVVKDKGADWLASRLRLYASPTLSRLYGWLRGKPAAY